MKSLTYRSTGIGIGVTVVLWILLLILFVSVKIPKKETYRTINITLEPVSKVPAKKQEQGNASTSNSAETMQEKQVEKPQKNEEIQKPAEEKQSAENEKTASDSRVQENKAAESNKAAVKTENVKKSDVSKTESNKSDQIVYKQSIEDKAKEAHENKKSKEISDADWDAMFGNEEASASSSQNTVAPTGSAPLVSTIGGNAASSQNAENERISGQTQSSTSGSGEGSASVKSALSAIKNQTYSLSVGNGVQSKTDIKAYSSGNGVSVEMNDGRLRELLEPKKPYIDISEENARLLDSSRTVKITFTVLPEGTVPQGLIDINPSLPQSIEAEIKQQVSRWIFISDPDGNRVQAVFTYTLEIR